MGSLLFCHIMHFYYSNLSSGSPVFVAVNLFFPAAGDVPFVDFGVFAVVLDLAGVFGVEVSPMEVE